MQPTENFVYFAEHDAELVKLGALAEHFFSYDPPTTLIKLRQFAELLSKLVAARHASYRTAVGKPTRSSYATARGFERLRGAISPSPNGRQPTVPRTTPSSSISPWLVSSRRSGAERMCRRR
jgi:hypothetical protein